MFALPITPYTKKNSNTLHYLSFIIFIHLVYLQKKSKKDKNTFKITIFNCENLELTLNSSLWLIQSFFCMVLGF